MAPGSMPRLRRWLVDSLLPTIAAGEITDLIKPGWLLLVGGIVRWLRIAGPYISGAMFVMAAIWLSVIIGNFIGIRLRRRAIKPVMDRKRKEAVEQLGALCESARRLKYGDSAGLDAFRRTGDMLISNLYGQNCPYGYDFARIRLSVAYGLTMDPGGDWEYGKQEYVNLLTAMIDEIERFGDRAVVPLLLPSTRDL